MFWLVPRPASLKETVSVPLLLRLPLALMKCSFWANACWAMRAKAIKTNATTAILRFICCTSPHRNDAASPWSVERTRVASRLLGRRCAGMRQDPFWRSRARWLCVAGQGRLCHNRPLANAMTSVSIGRVRPREILALFLLASRSSAKSSPLVRLPVRQVVTSYCKIGLGPFGVGLRDQPLSPCWSLNKQACAVAGCFVRSDGFELLFTKLVSGKRRRFGCGVGLPGNRSRCCRRGRPPQAAARRAGLEGVEKVSQLPQQHGHDGAGRWHASLPPRRIAGRAG